MGTTSEVPLAAQPAAQSAEFANKVFIVHGRDVPAKVEAARLIERAGLEAVILHEQPNSGKTIIEKFEAHGGSAGFAVVLLTPDDVGGLDRDHLNPRARQNVIGEMFWFAGKLGRDRVCALRRKISNCHPTSPVSDTSTWMIAARGSPSYSGSLRLPDMMFNWRHALA